MSNFAITKHKFITYQILINVFNVRILYFMDHSARCIYSG